MGTTQTVTVQTHEGAMDVFIAFPEGYSAKDSHPALIVLQEAFGVNEHIRKVCKMLASKGYVAAAPELFHRGGRGLEIPYTDFATKVMPLLADLTNERLTDDVSATFNYLKNLSGINKNKIATIGFCMGGFVAILAACHLPLAAAVSFYGGGLVKPRPGFGFGPFLNEFSQLQCPVLLAYGDEDHSIPAEDRKITGETLSAAKKKYEIRVYTGAGHAFLCEDRAAYNEEVAKVAWPETLSWLAKELA